MAEILPPMGWTDCFSLLDGITTTSESSRSTIQPEAIFTRYGVATKAWCPSVMQQRALSTAHIRDTTSALPRITYIVG